MATPTTDHLSHRPRLRATPPMPANGDVTRQYGGIYPCYLCKRLIFAFLVMPPLPITTLPPYAPPHRHGVSCFPHPTYPT